MKTKGFHQTRSSSNVLKDITNIEHLRKKNAIHHHLHSMRQLSPYKKKMD